jgi:hydroxypyruvate reductase
MTLSKPAKPLFSDYRRHVDTLVSAAIDAADPGVAVEKFLRREGGALSIGREPDAERFELTLGRVYLVAAGKAAIPMARAAARILGSDLEQGIVITKDTGTAQADVLADTPLIVYAAGHPVPDERGVRATKAAIKMLSRVGREDAVICLISGGASALLTDPLLPLKDWRKLIELLLKSGCSINELNTIRRAVDRIKSGGLARAASPASTYGLILSDVVGNPVNIIGSGPTVLEDDLVVGAVKVLGRYDIARQLDRNEWGRLAVALNQARTSQKAERPSVRNIIVGDVRDAATASMLCAFRLGFVGQLLTVHLDGHAREIGRLAAGIARDLSPGHCLIMGGETTVTVRGNGRGGRNQELALASAIAMERLPRAAVFSFTTDGEDGPTPAAGAVVTGQTARLARSLGLNPVAMLVDNDSHTFFSTLDARSQSRLQPHLITTGPTGTNVNDLVVILSYDE